MTRINSAIPVKYLTDEHLIAEHREIKRLPDAFRKALCSGALRRIPEKFCLGRGHVTFFLNKQAFLFSRYQAIHNECARRGFNVGEYSENWIKALPLMQIYKCWNNYEPTIDEELLLIDRIISRITDSKKSVFHYYGKPIPKAAAISLIKSRWPGED